MERKNIKRITEAQLKSIVREAIIKELSRQEINENWKGLAAGALMGLSTLAGGHNAMASNNTTANANHSVVSNASQEKQQNVGNSFKVKLYASNEKEAVKKAQAAIVNFCNQNNEKVMVSYLPGFEPHITHKSSTKFRDNTGEYTSENYYEYTAMLELSRSYNNGVVVLTLD